MQPLGRFHQHSQQDCRSQPRTGQSLEHQQQLRLLQITRSLQRTLVEAEQQPLPSKSTIFHRTLFRTLEVRSLSRRDLL